MAGFQVMLREVNFRIHMGAAALVLILSFWLGLTSTEWMVIVACIATVMAAEIFNTAIEQQWCYSGVKYLCRHYGGDT